MLFVTIETWQITLFSVAVALASTLVILPFGVALAWIFARKEWPLKTVVETMFHHAHTPAPRPSTRSELPIPAALEDLVMDCLEKDPARRPATRW